ncbi:glycosyltransferase family 4 protein [Oscillospiraceae bacterium HV4-5-C5C]|nr:glycosyltransferase family 4 protein [Oscillospiraceae bacterium HV4-5-C5C]
MRIMLINSFYAPDIRGGAEYSVKKLAEGLQSRGHTVRVLCTGAYDTEEVIDGIEIVRFKPFGAYKKINIHDVPRWRRLLGHLLDIWNTGNSKRLSQEIKRFAPDVINTNNLYGITPIVWKIAKKLDIRLVHTVRDYYLMCPLVALTCKKTNGRKCANPGYGCQLHRNMNRLHSKYVDCVTAPSALTLSILTDDGFFKSSDKKVIANATDFDISAVKKILSNRVAELDKKTGVLFVYLGTLSEQKGIRWMIDTFRSIENKTCKLYIAGKGDLEDYVAAETSKDNRIEFVGFLNEQQVSQLLQSTDVLLCPSLWEEPFGRVVLDAYKHAMPVICSNMGALTELVEDRKSGFVVEARNCEQLKNRMMYYIEDKNRIIQQAVNSVNQLEKYTIDHQLDEFEKVYET